MSILHRLHDPALMYFRLEPRRELTHVLAGLMEAMWIAPWFAIILPGAQVIPATSVLTFVAFNMLVAIAIVRVLDSRGMWENLRQIVFLVGLLIAVLLGVGVVFPTVEQAPIFETISDNVEAVERIVIPPLVPVLLLVSMVWWRGLRLAITTPTAIRVAFGMRLGILFFFASALFPQAREVTLTALPPFFFFGLLGISFARALSLRELGSQSSSFGPRWAGFMIATAGGITLIGLLVAALLGGVDPETFANIIQPILSGVVFLVAFLMTPIFVVVGALIEWVVNAMQSSGMLEEIVTPEVMELAQGDPNQQATELERAFQRLLAFLDRFGGIQVCVSAVVILIVVAVIVLTIRRQQRASHGDPEEREDLDGDALAGLRDMFRWGRDALNNAFNTIGRFGVGRDLFAALTVRRAYAQMVRVAAKGGFPRAVSQTPYEYQAILNTAYPEELAAVDAITQAYVRVHYGEVPENAEALQAVVEALEQFKAAASA